MKKSGIKKISGAFLLITLCMASCSKDETYINMQGSNTNGTNGTNDKPSGDNNNNNNNSGDDGSGTTPQSYVVHYKANVASSPFDAYTRGFVSTRATQPIGAGRKVSISVFNGSSNVELNVGYTSGSGVLNPDNNTQMTLPSGNYNIYAAGVNAPVGTAVPSFALNGGNYIVSSLTNGIDYIWASRTNFTPSTTASNYVDFIMNHSCAQIIINLKTAAGITTSQPTINITPSSTSGCSWNLQTGVITPAKSLGASTAMTVNSSTSSSNGTAYVGQITMVPLQYLAQDSLVCNFTVKLNSETSSRNYRLKIPPYSGTIGNGYLAGYSYRYNVELTSDTIKFNEANSVQVTDWIPVDISGSIIPEQVN